MQSRSTTVPTRRPLSTSGSSLSKGKCNRCKPSSTRAGRAECQGRHYISRGHGRGVRKLRQRRRTVAELLWNSSLLTLHLLVTPWRLSRWASATGSVGGRWGHLLLCRHQCPLCAGCCSPGCSCPHVLEGLQVEILNRELVTSSSECVFTGSFGSTFHFILLELLIDKTEGIFPDCRKYMDSALLIRAVGALLETYI